MTRTTYVLRNGALIEKRDAPLLHAGVAAPMVRPDGMAPMRSMADGRMYDSRSAYWLAFGGLAFLVCSASVTFAFGLGRVFQRVGDLRADVDELKQGEAEEGRARSSLREAFARFEARIEAKLEHLDARVGELTQALAGRAAARVLAPGAEGEGRP